MADGTAGEIRHRTVDAGGFRVAFDECGDPAAEPVLVLASMFIMARTYRRTIRQLGRTARAIALEMPGSGKSSPVPRPWAFEDYAAWLPAFLDAAGLDRVTLVGHSNSGAVALLAAADYPDRVSRLVLVDSVGAASDRSVPAIMLSHLADVPLEPRFTATALFDLAENALRHTRNFFAQLRPTNADYLPHAARVTVPTLVAWGPADLTMPPRCARAFHAAIPGSTLHLQPGGSHDWLIEHAAAFATVVADFITRTPPAPRPRRV